MGIWDEAGGAKQIGHYENEIIRLVEYQHYIATRKLVDSDEDQAILEQALDQSKPAAPTRNRRGQLHYLLYTPFRYPPLKSGGRFHTRLEQSLFYGAEDLQTAMAEVAFGRFLFFRHTQAVCEPMTVPYTHFVARVRSDKAVRLTHAPFAVWRARISDPASYAESQVLGRAMREAGVELFSYFSARHPEGVNVGLFSVDAFAQNKPVAGKDKRWDVFMTAELVEFQRASITGKARESHVFKAQAFQVAGRFPVV